MKFFSKELKIKKRIFLMLVLVIVLFTITSCDSKEKTLKAAKEIINDDFFYEGVSIQGQALGGMTKEQALAKLQVVEKDLVTQVSQLNIKFDGAAQVLKPEDIEANCQLEEQLERAFQVGRSSQKQNETEKIIENYQAIKQLEKKKIDFELDITYSDAALKTFVDKMVQESSKEPVSAEVTGFDLEKKEFQISESEDGYHYQTEKLYEDLKKYLDEKKYSETIVLEKEIILSQPTKAELEQILGLVSEGQTFAKKVDPPRDHNIKLLFETLNGHIVKAGEVFSFNDFIGPRTAEKGYKAAHVILNGEFVNGIGGGICQNTTTLYQAVAKGDYEIVARSPHVIPSSYTDVGLDATIDYGSVDMKFKNNSDYPLAIVATYEKPTLLVQIYGRKLQENHSIELVAEHHGYTGAGANKVVYSDELYQGEEKVVKKPRSGQSATSYKVYKTDGVESKREVLAKSSYPAMAGVVTVGTREHDYVADDGTSSPGYYEAIGSEENFSAPEIAAPEAETPLPAADQSE